MKPVVIPPGTFIVGKPLKVHASSPYATMSGSIDFKDLDKVLAGLDQKVLKRVQEDMMKHAEEMLMKGFTTPYVDPVKVSTHEMAEHQSIHVGVELSMRELHSVRFAHDIFERTKDKIAEHLAHEVRNRIFSMTANGVMLDKMIEEEVRKEVSAAVKKAVVDRVDDFVEEMLA